MKPAPMTPTRPGVGRVAAHAASQGVIEGSQREEPVAASERSRQGAAPRRWRRRGPSPHTLEPSSSATARPPASSRKASRPRTSCTGEFARTPPPRAPPSRSPLSGQHLFGQRRAVVGQVRLLAHQRERARRSPRRAGSRRPASRPARPRRRPPFRRDASAVLCPSRSAAEHGHPLLRSGAGRRSSTAGSPPCSARAGRVHVAREQDGLVGDAGQPV